MVDQSDLSKIKQLELVILDEFVRICNKYEIDYFLSGGSCLGVVRHQGFIPWDDDIDISMYRKDYDRFCDIAKTELDDKFVLQNYETEPNCGLVFGKIRLKNTIYSEKYSAHISMSQGVWIDLFPYDNIPDEKSKQDKLYKKISFWKNLYIVRCGYRFPENKNVVFKIPYYIAKIISVIFPKGFLIKRLDLLMRQYNNCRTKYVFPYGGAYAPEKERMPSEILEDYIELDFEGKPCKTLAAYDYYLTSLYGDYHKLPPENERKAGVHNMLEFTIL